MSRQKLFNTIFVGVLIFVGLLTVVIISKKINCENIISEIDYIEVASTGEKINIESIETIKPTIWKGSYDGYKYYVFSRKIKNRRNRCKSFM